MEHSIFRPDGYPFKEHSDPTGQFFPFDGNKVEAAGIVIRNASSISIGNRKEIGADSNRVGGVWGPVTAI